MKKLLSSAMITLALFSMQSIQAAVDYTPTFTGNKTNTTRYINSVVLQSASFSNHEANSLTLSNSERTQWYVDKSGSAKMKAAAGETVTLTVNKTGDWMNAYVYIDADNNGFTAGIENNYVPTGDLVSYSFYNNGSDSDQSGWNSAGDVINGGGAPDPRSTVVLPTFTAPTNPGEYRMRIKLDWCNIDPNGDNDNKFGNFTSNGGHIIDVTLEVAEKQQEEQAKEYAINRQTGNWTAANTAGNWASSWKSTDTPKITLAQSEGKNNMAYYNNSDNIQLFTCLANAASNGVYSSTYIISVEEGYNITGYRFDFVSSGANDVTVIPNGSSGITANSSTAQRVSVVNAKGGSLSFEVRSNSNMFANTSNFYVTVARSASAATETQEIFVTNSGGIPYRIPAIAMAKNGDLIAVADYRHSGSDIGVVNNGRIDLHARISKDNGSTWGNRFSIVDGQGASSPDFMHVGFGDPAIVADRESNRVLVLSCAGNVSFQNGTRNNHQNIARFYSENNGATWSEPVDIADAIYAMWDNSSYGPANAMFVGSGKIHQSRYVKVNNYYRLYCSVLLRAKNNAYTNFVLYSDDFGGNWKVLGGVDNAPIPSGGDEPKVEELPNGNIILSSRINGGRYFNIFTFTDKYAATGSWGTLATSNSSNNGVVALNNSTNGEIMILPVIRKQDNQEMWIALQSVPFGSDRNNVGIYYKELASEADYNTPANFAKDWDGRYQVSYLPSAYSTMCLQKDSTIAFLYEESTHGAAYTIIYKNYTIENITNGAYSIAKSKEPEVEPEGPSEATIALIAEAKELLHNSGIGYPAESPRATLQAAIAVAEADPTSSNGAKLNVAMDDYITATDIILPQAGKKYTFTAVYGNKECYIYNNNGTLAVATRGEEIPADGQFVCEYNANDEYKFQFKTADNTYYLAYPSIGGRSWLDNESLTGLETVSGNVTKFNINKIVAGGEVSATNEALFGLVKLEGWRGYHNTENKDVYGTVVINHSTSAFDGSEAPFYNATYTSAFRIEEVGASTAIEKIAIDKDNTIYDLQGRRIEKIAQPGIYIINGKKILVK